MNVRREKAMHHAASYAFRNMSSADKWALYDGEYERIDIAERFGNVFLAREPRSAWAYLVKMLEEWIVIGE